MVIMDPQLVNYIHQRRQQGVVDNAIRQELIAAGWPTKLVDQAFNPGKAYGNTPGLPIDEPAYVPPSIQNQVLSGIGLGISLLVLIAILAGYVEPFISEGAYEGLSGEESSQIVISVLFLVFFSASIGATIPLIANRFHLKPPFLYSLNIVVITCFLFYLASLVFPEAIVLVLFLSLAASVGSVVLVVYLHTLPMAKQIRIGLSILSATGLVLIYAGLLSAGN